jgi:predicted transcriptional regulator
MGFTLARWVYYDVIRIRWGCVSEEKTVMSTLTVRLTEREDRDLQLVCEQSGKTKSEVVRELLAQSLQVYRLRQSLQAAHAELGPAARQAGWLTEDDILRDAP